jgi:hypothetical protein
MGYERVRSFFEQARPRLLKLAGRLVRDPEAAVSDAEVYFDRMLPGLAYTDKPEHPFAAGLFVPTVNLALFLALRDRGIDTHAFGAAMLTGLSRAPTPPAAQQRPAPEALARRMIELGEESQRNAKPGEDVFEAVSGDGEDFDFGLNVESCSICHQFAKFDAMEMVPYICATDDIMSEKQGTGLRRTGTIALGAKRCDFRFRNGGEPRPLAPRHPAQIRWSKPES